MSNDEMTDGQAMVATMHVMNGASIALARALANVYYDSLTPLEQHKLNMQGSRVAPQMIERAKEQAIHG